MTTPAGHNAVEVSSTIQTELDKLALGTRILEMEGHGHRTIGHTAMRDPEGRGVWIKRWGLALGEVSDWTDFQLIDFDGHLLYGDNTKRHTEWPIHARIMLRRPDVNVIGHTHPTYGTVFSASDEPLRPTTSSGVCFNTSPRRYTRTSEIICTPEMGDELADILGDDYVVFMRNHGVVFVGDTVEQMVIAGIDLEECCKQMLMIKSSGLAFSVPDAEEQERRHQSTFVNSRNTHLFFDYFTAKLAATQAQGHPQLPTTRRR